MLLESEPFTDAIYQPLVQTDALAITLFAQVLHANAHLPEFPQIYRGYKDYLARLTTVSRSQRAPHGTVCTASHLFFIWFHQWVKPQYDRLSQTPQATKAKDDRVAALCVAVHHMFSCQIPGGPRLSPDCRQSFYQDCPMFVDMVLESLICAVHFQWPESILMEHVHLRLQSLEKFSDSTLFSQQHFELIWTELILQSNRPVGDPYVASVAQTACVWFSKMIKWIPSPQQFGRKVLAEWSQLNTVLLSSFQFEFFKTVFLDMLNIPLGKLTRILVPMHRSSATATATAMAASAGVLSSATAVATSQFMLVDHQLEGLTELWDIVFTSKDHVVEKSALALLAQLHQADFSAEQASSMGAFLDASVFKCMTRVRELQQTASRHSVDDSTLQRVFSVLHLLTEPRIPGQRLAPHGEPTNMLTITLFEGTWTSWLEKWVTELATSTASAGPNSGAVALAQGSHVALKPAPRELISFVVSADTLFFEVHRRACEVLKLPKVRLELQGVPVMPTSVFYLPLRCLIQDSTTNMSIFASVDPACATTKPSNRPISSLCASATNKSSSAVLSAAGGDMIVIDGDEDPSSASSTSFTTCDVIRHPSLLLAQEYFGDLFSALATVTQTGSLTTLHSSTSSSVWRLLMKLPTNNDIHRRFAQLTVAAVGQSGWIDMLNADSSNSYQFTYVLQVLAKVARNIDDHDLIAWWSTFAAHGGISRLAKMFGSITTPTQPCAVWMERSGVVVLLIELLCTSISNAPISLVENTGVQLFEHSLELITSLASSSPASADTSAHQACVSVARSVLKLLINLLRLTTSERDCVRMIDLLCGPLLHTCLLASPHVVVGDLVAQALWSCVRHWTRSQPAEAWNQTVSANDVFSLFRSNVVNTAVAPCLAAAPVILASTPSSSMLAVFSPRPSLPLPVHLLASVFSSLPALAEVARPCAAASMKLLHDLVLLLASKGVDVERATSTFDVADGIKSAWEQSSWWRHRTFSFADSLAHSTDWDAGLLSLILSDSAMKHDPLTPSTLCALSKELLPCMWQQLVVWLRSLPRAESWDSSTPDDAIWGVARVAILLLQAIAPLPMPLSSMLAPDSTLLSRDGGNDTVGFVQMLIHVFLFNSPPSSADAAVSESASVISPAPLCKHMVTREAVLHLVRAVVLRHHESLAWLLDSMASGVGTKVPAEAIATLASPQISKGHGLVMPRQTPLNLRRLPGNYVGLVNQGATCYMNSLLQQLFFTPELRFGLLSSNACMGLSAAEKRDDLFFQLQTMFAFLQDSHKSEYHTHSFTSAYRDAEGRPINVCAQMDVDEFLNMLIERLEVKLSGTPQARM